MLVNVIKLSKIDMKLVVFVFFVFIRFVIVIKRWLVKYSKVKV